MSAIIFATIGDPTVYQEKEYTFQGNGSVKSKASFLAIKEFLKSEISKTVVILGISVAEKLKCKDKCTDYDSCRQCITDMTSKELGINDDKSIEYMIAPNILGNFKSKPDYFFSYVYYNSLRILEKEKPKKIYLDTSQGINYMPILGKDALLLATSAYAAKQGEEISFGTFNSDPVTNIKGPYEIHLTESIRISPLAGLKYVTTQILNKDLNYFKSLEDEGIITDGNNNVEKIYRMAIGLDNGLFVYFADKSDEIQDLIKKFEVDEKVVMRSVGENIILEYKDAKHALVHALLYVALKFKKDEQCLDLEKLKEFANKYADAVTSAIIMNEIEQIEEKKRNITEQKKLLKDVLGKSGNRLDQRILYAHGGLPFIATYVYKSGEKICITYGDKIDEIEKHMANEDINGNKKQNI